MLRSWRLSYKRLTRWKGRKKQQFLTHSHVTVRTYWFPAGLGFEQHACYYSDALKRSRCIRGLGPGRRMNAANIRCKIWLQGNSKLAYASLNSRINHEKWLEPELASWHFLSYRRHLVHLVWELRTLLEEMMMLRLDTVFLALWKWNFQNQKRLLEGFVYVVLQAR